jgi:hypothetical protein
MGINQVSLGGSSGDGDPLWKILDGSLNTFISDEKDEQG